MAMDDAKFAELLREAGLGEYTEAILRYKQPCVRRDDLIAKRFDHAMCVMQSY